MISVRRFKTVKAVFGVKLLTPISASALPRMSSTPVAPSNATKVSRNSNADPLLIFNKLHDSINLQKKKWVLMFCRT